MAAAVGPNGHPEMVERLGREVVRTPWAEACPSPSKRPPAQGHIAGASGPARRQRPPWRPRGPGPAAAEAAARALAEVGVDGVQVRLDVRVAGEAAHDAARARGAPQHRRREAPAARQRGDQARREARAQAVGTVAVAAHALVAAVALAQGGSGHRVARERGRPGPRRTVRRRGKQGEQEEQAGERRAGPMPRLGAVRHAERPRRPGPSGRSPP